MSPRKSHRPPVLVSVARYAPVLALIVIAVFTPGAWVLIPLLLANALAMGVLCHAIGLAPEADFARTLARRAAAWLVLFVAYTVLVLLLVAVPMVSLTTAPSLGSSMGLALALAIALAALWRAWPAFGLIMLWDDALPPATHGSWLLATVTRSLSFARHLALEERFFTHFLPSALATLVLAAGTLTLSGLYDVLPPALRMAGLWLYGLVVIPACCLTITNRTVRALLPDHRKQPAQDALEATLDHGDEPAQTLAPDVSHAASTASGDALLAAARDGDIERALNLLKEGADPNVLPAADDANQHTVLTLAALHPDTRLLRALIAHGADINCRHQGLTTLLTVTRDGCMSRAEAVVVLLANGAETTITDADGNTALHHAARSTDLSAAADLVDAGAPIDTRNRRGRTPLAIACHAANWPMAEWLLEHRAQPHVEGSEPALLAAAGIADDDPDGVDLLLRHGAQPNACDPFGRTALMNAALEGRVAIVECLLGAHADTDACDQHGTTALMEAARTGANDVVGALCGAGSRIDARDRHGRDALTLACVSERANTATVDILMRAGADPHAAGDDGSALDRAVQAGRWDLVAVLDPSTELPANVASTREPETDADTPDHLLDALRFGHWAVVGSFTRRVREWPQGERARLYLAVADGEHPRACAWLLDHGLDGAAQLDDGQTLLVAALDALPASVDAVAALLARGASPTGAGLLARAMSRLTDTPEPGVPLTLAMLNAGADPFGALADGRTPLHVATARGWLGVLEALLAMGAAPNARDAGGSTPLHAALQHAPGAVAGVRALVAAGADPEATTANGETPLGLAMNLDQPELLRWLRWAPWPLPGRPLRPSDLPAAANAGDAAAIGKLLELGFAVDSADARGATALVYACGRGHHEAIITLLGAGADAGLVTPSGVTPLVAAINMRQLDVMALLVERGARVDQRLPGDITALMVACAKGYADAASTLLTAGADINASDARGRTPLHIACQYCFATHDSLHGRRLLDVLLAAGADVNHVGAKGLTPLLMLLGAHEKPGTDGDPTHLGALLPLLLDAGARHDHADPRGVTALHACAMHALVAPAHILLARGADRRAVDALDRRAADVARQLGYADMAVELDTRHGPIPGVQQTLRTPAQPAD